MCIILDLAQSVNQQGMEYVSPGNHTAYDVAGIAGMIGLHSYPLIAVDPIQLVFYFE